jgi:hypothetical protein
MGGAFWVADCACALCMPAGRSVAPNAAAPEESKSRRPGLLGSLLELIVIAINSLIDKVLLLEKMGTLKLIKFYYINKYMKNHEWHLETIPS